MYAILRGDIHMSTGKAMAQVGHAFTEPLLTGDPQSDRHLQYKAERPGTKVVLLANDEVDLHRALRILEKIDIPHALVYDQGHVHPPDFDGGTPVLTALGFGPARREEVRQVTKYFAPVP